jgi:hypothetical protein
MGLSLGSIVKSVAGAVVAVATAPIKVAEAVVNVAQGDIPLGEAAGQVGQAVAAAALGPAGILSIEASAAAAQAVGLEPGKVIQEAAKIADLPYAMLIHISEEALGDPGKIFAEAAFAAARYPLQIGAFAAAGGMDNYKGVHVAPAVALLAGAISAAASEYRTVAKPLPADVRAILNPYFSKPILDRARYAVGTLHINLPDLINEVQVTYFAEAHAVTVDEVIVFSRVPDTSESGLMHWAHEIHHVAQYDEWGVTRFAYEYISDARRVEAEADSRAAEIVASLKDNVAPGAALEIQGVAKPGPNSESTTVARGTR